MRAADLIVAAQLFHAIRESAERSGRRFMFFTPEGTPDAPKATHVFNPFQSFDVAGRTAQEVCQLLLDALSLHHGDGYGRGFYSKRNRQLLYDAMKRKPRDFPELKASIEDLVRLAPSLYKDAIELVVTVSGLAEYKQLLINQDSPVPSKNVIHMPTVLEQGQVVYFWLPAAIESMSVRELGKLALFSLVSAAIDRQSRGLPTRETYVIIDEFQRLVGENFKILLEQARSFGIGAILANQSLSDLRTPSADIRSTVIANTRVKMYFSVQESALVRELSMASGEDAIEMSSESVSERLTLSPLSLRTLTKTRSLSTRARLSLSDIRAISDHPKRFLLHVARGSGFSQFGGLVIPVQTDWAMSHEEYQRLQRLPWPTVEETAGTAIESDRGHRTIDADMHAEEAMLRQKLAEAHDEQMRREGRLPQANATSGSGVNS